MKSHKEKVAEGKKNRAGGAAFEKRVRADLESKGWVIDRWTNNVEFGKESIPTKINSPYDTEITVGKIIPAKVSWSRTPHGMFPMGLNSGFPDFVCFNEQIHPRGLYSVIGIECKSNGTLTKIEKEKCQWYLDNNVFSKILIAEKTKIKNRVVIVYHNFVEKYKK